jgi:hypothetical protein
MCLSGISHADPIEQPAKMTQTKPHQPETKGSVPFVSFVFQVHKKTPAIRAIK